MVVGKGCLVGSEAVVAAPDEMAGALAQVAKADQGEMIG